MTEFLAALADLPFAALAVRMAAVAVFIVIVAMISERTGPFFGAMVASLPVYTGPVYVFLALDHPPEFLERVTTASVAAFAVTPIYLLMYGLLAHVGKSMLLSLGGAFVAWLSCAVFVQLYDWSLPEALLFAVPIFTASILLAPRFTDAVPLKAGARSWIDLVVRVVLVGKQELDRLETRFGGRPEAIEELPFGEHHRQVGGKTRHGSLCRLGDIGRRRLNRCARRVMAKRDREGMRSARTRRASLLLGLRRRVGIAGEAPEHHVGR